MRIRPHILALAAIVLAFSVLAGCATKNPAEGATVSNEVQFLDSFSFDRKLSASLGAGQPEVNVLFPAVITLNNIPERMDKWLSKVEKFGGKVEIQAEPEAGRGIITEIFSLFIKIYEAAEEKLVYAPAKDYNVLVRYKATSGIITRVSFVNKSAPAPEPAAQTPPAPPAIPAGPAPAAPAP